MNEREPTLAEEAGLPDSWKPVDSAPIIPATSPLPNSRANLYGGSISPTLQHDFIFSQTKYGTPAIPSLPLMPLSPSGQPTVGAAVQSGASNTINTNVTAVAAGSNGNIQFNKGGALGANILLNWDNINNILVIGGLTNGTIFNASVGFQIGGLAVAGKYLRGNGTNFISATLSGSDIGTGLVPVAYGGTDANLSATGGTSEVLLQTTVGGPITVRQLTYADISGSPVPIAIWNTTAKTTTYPAVAGDMVLGNTSGGGFTVTLPLSSANKNESIRVKKTSSDSNSLTIGVSGSDMIDGQSTQVITFQYTDVEMTSDGAGNWWIA